MAISQNPYTLLKVYCNVVFRLDETINPNGSFVIITGDNPSGHPCSPTINRCRSMALFSNLRRHGKVTRLWGCSPDFTHCEQSFAVGLSLYQTYKFARCYEQNAVYWIEQGRLFLLPCKIRVRKIYLGYFLDRIV